MPWNLHIVSVYLSTIVKTTLFYCRQIYLRILIISSLEWFFPLFVGVPIGKKTSIPNKKKVGGTKSKQINCKRSTETITSSKSTATVAIGEDAEAIAFDFLPEKSLAKYLRSYERFMAWKSVEKIDKDYFSAEVVLDYFNYLKRECFSFTI